MGFHGLQRLLFIMVTIAYLSASNIWRRLYTFSLWIRQIQRHVNDSQKKKSLNHHSRDRVLSHEWKQSLERVYVGSIYFFRQPDGGRFRKWIGTGKWRTFSTHIRIFCFPDIIKHNILFFIRLYYHSDGVRSLADDLCDSEKDLEIFVSSWES